LILEKSVKKVEDRNMMKKTRSTYRMLSLAAALSLLSLTGAAAIAGENPKGTGQLPPEDQSCASRSDRQTRPNIFLRMVSFSDSRIVRNLL
jgi:hypothetical protein